jgi:MFS family permease
MTTLELTSNHEDARRIDRLAQWTRVLCVLFFFSGFPALIYQLTWQRALFRIFGVNIESVTIVVTAFMLGLGLGSLAGGWLSKRRGIPLLPLLGGIELMTGAFGLLSLQIFDRVSAFTIGLPLPTTAAVSLALVIVPTLLMGATLPVLVGHSGSSLRPCRERARPPLLRQYAWRWRGMPCLCRVSVPVCRHAARGLCRRRA